MMLNTFMSDNSIKIYEKESKLKGNDLRQLGANSFHLE